MGIDYLTYNDYGMMGSLALLTKLRELEDKQLEVVYRIEREIDEAIQNSIVFTDANKDKYIVVCEKSGIIVAHGDSEREFSCLGSKEDYEECLWIIGELDRYFNNNEEVGA